MAAPRLGEVTGSSVMEAAEHREPCESRGSRTVLGGPEGEIPSGYSSKFTVSLGRRSRPNVSFHEDCFSFNPDSGRR